MKFKCIKYPQGTIVRVPDEIASQAVASGQAHYVSKGHAKSMYKRVQKISQNQEILEKHDFSKEQNLNFLHRDGKKTYAYLHKKDHVDYVLKGSKELKRKRSWWQRLLSKVDNILGTKLAPQEVQITPDLVQVTTPRYQRYLVAIN
jgi:hypothetical protein